MKKLFGTDGVRGVAGEFLTSEFSYKLGKYIADYWRRGQKSFYRKRHKRVKGHDKAITCSSHHIYGT